MLKYNHKEVRLMTLKHVIISDFDYTMFEHDDPHNTAQNLLAIKRWRKAGNLFVIATGRGIVSLSLGLHNYADYADYLVLNDGATIMKPNGEILYSDHIKEELANAVTEKLQQANFSKEYAIVGYYGSKELNYIKPNCYKFRLWFHSADDCAKAEQILDEDFGRRLSYIVYHDVTENFDTRLDWINDKMQHAIEVNLVGTNKRTGLAILFNMLNLYDNGRNIISVGDDMNDICMLEAYNGYVIDSTVEEAVRRRIPSSHIIQHLHGLITDQLKALA